MTILAAGLILFFATHLISSAREARADIIGKLGEKGYKGAFSLLSLIGFVLIVVGKGHAPFEPLWDPPSWGRSVTLSLMPVAFMLLAATYMPTNLKRHTAHPMLWGVSLWATLHLLANGDRASLLLFGGFLLYSLYAMQSQTRRGARPKGRPVPFMKDVLVIAAGIVISILLVFSHGYLFGVPLRG